MPAAITVHISFTWGVLEWIDLVWFHFALIYMYLFINMYYCAIRSEALDECSLFTVHSAWWVCVFATRSSHSNQYKWINYNMISCLRAAHSYTIVGCCVLLWPHTLFFLLSMHTQILTLNGSVHWQCTQVRKQINAPSRRMPSLFLFWWKSKNLHSTETHFVKCEFKFNKIAN